MDPESISILVALVSALLLLAFAVTAKAALNSLSRARYERLAEQGNGAAQALTPFLDHPSSFLRTTGLLRLIALVVAIGSATMLLVRIAPPQEITALLAVGFFVLLVVVGEIVPRAIGVTRPEHVVLALSLPLRLLSFVLSPLAHGIGQATDTLARVLGHRGSISDGPLLTPEELRVHVAASEEEGLIEEDEREMIDAVLDLEDTTVREIMVPRLDIVALPAETSIIDAIDIIVANGYSRLPVYEENIDNIIGILYAKDIFRLVRSDRLNGTVRDLVRPAYFIPESKRIDELLHELQQKKVHIAIVVDEYGGTAGLATIEDLLEEIVGEIQDEYDVEEAKIVEGQNGEAIFDATVRIDDVNDTMDLHLAGEEVDTVGGLIYEKLGRVPQVGDKVVVDGAVLSVISTAGRRIKQVRVTRVVEETEDQSVA